MKATHGFVRKISRSLAQCELLHLPRQRIDVALAEQQHAHYVAILAAAGVTLTILPEAPELPDSTFVEDTMIVLDEVIVVCRLGTASRELEAEQNLSGVNQRRRVQRIRPPGTLEGGDVLRLGKKLFVGLSQRTNREGIDQLAQITAPFGYEVIPVGVRGCLHLKTAITSPTEGTLVANQNWIDISPFSSFEIIPVPATEPWGANLLRVNNTVLVTASAPRIADKLASRNLAVKMVDISEIQKAEAGLSCLSVLYSNRPQQR